MRVYIDENNDTLVNVAILGGCHGYLISMLRLMRGMKVVGVIDVLKGVKCGNRDTSCPDQIAKALQEYLDKKSKS